MFFDLQGNLQRVGVHVHRFRHTKLRKRKLRVAQTVPEGISRLDAAHIVPAVAHAHSLTVPDLLVFTGVVLVGRDVLTALRPCNGQLAGRIILSKHGVCGSLAAHHTGKERAENGVDIGLPCSQIDRAGGVDHNDDLAVGGLCLFDGTFQRGLVVRVDGKILPVTPFVSVCANHSDPAARLRTRGSQSNIFLAQQFYCAGIGGQ